MNTLNIHVFFVTITENCIKLILAQLTPHNIIIHRRRMKRCETKLKTDIIHSN